MSRVLVLNPGSTSTKLAVYDDEVEVCAATVRHSVAELAGADGLAGQAALRRDVIAAELAAAGVPIGSLDAVVGRGGLTRPVPGGTYLVDADLLTALAAPVGEHASNVGGPLAAEFAAAAGAVPAFIVDPVVVDELDDVARFSGHPEIERRSIFHALNSKAVARRYAAGTGRRYDELNLIVAHLGGGISVGAHRHGRVVDVNNALDGDGPFAPERAGGLPAASWVKLLLNAEMTPETARRLLVGGGGLASLVGTSDVREVARLAGGEGTSGGEVAAGEAVSPARARLALYALGYQVAKEIGSRAAALSGEVDAILLTGGLAHDESIVAAITARVDWIAPVVVFPGEDELAALRDGALRVLRGEEPARSYAAEVLR